MTLCSVRNEACTLNTQASTWRNTYPHINIALHSDSHHLTDFCTLKHTVKAHRHTPILIEKTDLLSCSRHHVLSVSYRCHSDAAHTARERSQVWMAEPAINSSVCHSQWTISRPHNPPQWITEISVCLCVWSSSAGKRLYRTPGDKRCYIVRLCLIC